MKKYLFSLLLVGIGFISFCSSELIINHITSNSPYQIGNRVSIGVNANSTVNITPANGTLYPYSSFCLELGTILTCSVEGVVYTGPSINNICIFNNSDVSYVPSIICVNSTTSRKYVYGYNTPSLSLGGSQYTSEECQSEYNLVPSSDLTSCQGDLSSCNSSLNGCQSNLSGCMTNLDNYSTSLNNCSTNLNVCNTSLSSCMSSNCPTDSGTVSWSSLFVNGIQHLGAPTIRVNIPEEISRDYLSTTEDFVLDVEGYNQDTEYIESVLEVQNYTPTREDFNNTFMLFKSFSGLIVACLFVILVFYFLKKLFK